MATDFEHEIFKRKQFQFQKLVAYGFKKEKDQYTISKMFMDNAFRADITIDKNGNITGKVIDMEFEDEYANFRVENQQGEFVNSVREAYQEVLKDIAERCCTSNYFCFPQANRLAKLIHQKYGDEPEFPWKDDWEDGVFRNPESQKWYGLIMTVDRNKITEGEGKVNVLNVKLSEGLIKRLLKQKGYYSCYHMNKKNWISILLDDTLSDETIMKHIIDSHKYTEMTNEWIVPANPKYYDIIGHFRHSDIVTWKQSSEIKVGDIVYMYVGQPYSAILYKCKAIEVNIPYEYQDDNISMKKMMKLKVLETYDKDQYTFEMLNQNGVRAVRGPRFMPKELSDKIKHTKKK